MALIVANTTQNSTTLAAMDASLATPDTRVWNKAVGAEFAYTISTAGLVTDSVVAVANVTGARWIKQGAGLTTVAAGSGISVDATDPANPIVSVTHNEVTTTLGAAGNTIAVSGLNGDADVDYHISGVLTIDTTGGNVATTVTLQINGSATNCSSVTADHLTGSVFSTTLMQVTLPVSSRQVLHGDVFMFNGVMRAKSGQPRIVQIDGSTTAALHGDIYHMEGFWNDTASNITSLSIVGVPSAGVNSFAAGSYVTVRRMA